MHHHIFSFSDELVLKSGAPLKFHCFILTLVQDLKQHEQHEDITKNIPKALDEPHSCLGCVFVLVCSCFSLPDAHGNKVTKEERIGGMRD